MTPPVPAKLRRGRAAVLGCGAAIAGAYLLLHFAPPAEFPSNWVLIGVLGVSIVVVSAVSRCPGCKHFLFVQLLWGNGCPHCGMSFRDEGR